MCIWIVDKPWFMKIQVWGFMVNSILLLGRMRCMLIDMLLNLHHDYSYHLSKKIHPMSLSPQYKMVQTHLLLLLMDIYIEVLLFDHASKHQEFNHLTLIFISSLSILNPSNSLSNLMAFINQLVLFAVQNLYHHRLIRDHHHHLILLNHLTIAYLLNFKQYQNYLNF